MLQSFSVQGHHRTNHPQLSCQKCKQKPSQFILLLCDHIICGTCLNLSNSVQGQYGFDGVRCPCGAVTYFHKKQQSVLEGDECDCEDNECDGENCKEKSYERHGVSVNIHQRNKKDDINRRKNISERHSVGLIQSNNTIGTKNISRLKTEAYSKCNYSISHKDSHLKDEFMLQKSKHPMEEDSQMMNESRKCFKKVCQKGSNKASIIENKNKGQYDPSSINSESLVEQSFHNQQNQNPNHTNAQIRSGKISTKKQALQTFQESCYEQQPSRIKSTKASKQNNLSQELKSQISFLQIQHRKLLEDLNRAYSRAVSKINEDYESLENNLRDLCLESIVFNTKNSHVDIGKIIQLRYEGKISNNVEKMTQQIKKFAFNQNSLNSQNLIDFNEEKIKDFFKQATKDTLGNERKIGMARFSSPQPNCKIHTQTQQVCIFSPRIKGNQDLYYKINSSTKDSVESNPFVNSLYQSTQSGPRLLKKSVKHRTNVIIQL